jgi:hypothetical protein
VYLFIESYQLRYHGIFSIITSKGPFYFEHVAEVLPYSLYLTDAVLVTFRPLRDLDAAAPREACTEIKSFVLDHGYLDKNIVQVWSSLSEPFSFRLSASLVEK